MYTVCLSVRQLVEFILREGDLNRAFSGTASTERMLEGSRLHRYYQAKEKKKNPLYASEIPFLFHENYKDFLWEISGRADGLLEEENLPTVIEEIKSTLLPVSLLNEMDYPVHWAQVLCYAYFYLRENPSMPKILVKLTYIQVETMETISFQKEYSQKRLEEFFFDLLDQYAPWAKISAEHTEKRNRSLKALPFPFASYREGQRALSASVYHTIERKKKLFVSAPTGIGKTISTLFPALKAVGEEKGDKIFYLTAKEATRQVAVESMRLLGEKGADVSFITLTAKSKICILERPECSPESCPRAKGHFDRILEALFPLVSEERQITREVIESYAEQHQVCPYELSLEASNWMDVVIGDYNHALDPVSKLRRFFTDEKSNAILLFDEAHNLVDRARDMFSAHLNKSDFLLVKRFFKGKDASLYNCASSINQYFSDTSKEIPENQAVFEEPPEDLTALLFHFVSLFDLWQKEHPSEDTSTVLDLYFAVQAYLRIEALYDSHYKTLWEKNARDTTIHLFCLDPSKLLKEGLSIAYSTILFSATLAPLPYYFDVLGGTKDEDYQVSLPSPFDSSHLCLLATTYISTRYQGREKSFLPIANSLAAIVNEKAGNYMVYFPSYQYLRNVLEVFQTHFPEISVLVQENGMNLQEQTDFLASFETEQNESLLGFSVLGGAFSEGIDLVGERLIGSIIISAGLPQVSFIQNVIQSYYDEKSGNGFYYAYTFPGFNKVLQAAGRVIRSENDQGIVVLMDDRFSSPIYQSLFPHHWEHIKFVSSQVALLSQISHFYERKENL